MTYSEISPRFVLPVISLSQASAHSRMMSVAYLCKYISLCTKQAVSSYFLFLHSPEKAN